MTPTTSNADILSVDQIRELVATHLHIPLDTLEPWAPLSGQGLDSLSSLELVALLEHACGRTLPASLVAECPDITALAAAIAGGDRRDDDLRERVARDAKLPADIRPAGCRAPTVPAGRVLLTGATGFLGAWLLRALLDETSASMVCLVRGGGDERIRKNLERYGLSTHDLAARVTAVSGELEAEGLGLSVDEGRDLSESVDAIYHAGADVNWVSHYDSLRAANVGGTLEVLRLACSGRPKRLVFVSSLSVCYAVDGPPIVNERSDMIRHAAALPLGYAQSKCVAETLVREAAARGLQATIVRPALISGDARSGASSGGDLIARLMRGCVVMGAAPDLDWTFDAVPVDVAAHAIVQAGASPETATQPIHLVHPHPRHWRECVLWMNLFGYRVQLEPYRRWMRRLATQANDAGHPLYTLRPFFLSNISGRAIPEHMESSRRSSVDSSASRAVERQLGVRYPALNGELLERYFSHYVAAGVLPPPAGRAGNPVRRVATRAVPALPEGLSLVDIDGTPLRVKASAMANLGTPASIVSELTTWRSGSHTGLFRASLTVSSRTESRYVDAIVKVKAPDEHVLDVAEALAALCDHRVHHELCQVRELLGIRGGAAREAAIYSDRTSDLCACMPHCYGTWQDEADRSQGIVLERLKDTVLIDAADSIDGWTAGRVDAAVDGLAAMHAVWIGREIELLDKPWLGYVRASSNVERLTPLWDALAAHARTAGGVWAGRTLSRRHGALIETVGTWWPALEAVPRTLIHNDCNPRNVALLRRNGTLRMAAYDWELATLGAPQRDLAELLCFVLPPQVEDDVVDRLIEHHRLALERRSGLCLDREQWRAGFESGLADLLVSRLAFYALIDRVLPQRFLPRVVHTWMRLDILMNGVRA